MTDDYMQQLNDISRKYSPEAQEQFWDNNSGRAMELYTEYPNLLRSSILTSSITNLEKTFLKIHRAITENSNLKITGYKNKRFKNSTIENIIQSIDEVIPMKPLYEISAWEDLIFYIKIRNRVIHDNGSIHPVHHKELHYKIKDIGKSDLRTVTLNPYHELIFLENFSQAIINTSIEVLNRLVEAVQQYVE